MATTVVASVGSNAGRGHSHGGNGGGDVVAPSDAGLRKAQQERLEQGGGLWHRGRISEDTSEHLLWWGLNDFFAWGVVNKRESLRPCV